MGIKHAFTSPKGDGGDATLVRPSSWNDDHVCVLPGAADYSVVLDGSTYKAVHGKTGAVAYSSATFATMWNALIAGLAASGPGSGHVALTSMGTVPVTASLNAVNGMTITAPGVGTILQAQSGFTPGANGACILDLYNHHGLHVSGLVIDGNGVTGTIGMLIKGSGGGDPLNTVYDNHIHSCNAANVQFGKSADSATGSVNTKFHHNMIGTTSGGLSATAGILCYAGDGWIQDNNIYNGGDSCIDLEGTVAWHVLHNHAVINGSVTGACIKVGKGQNHVIDGNYLDNVSEANGGIWVGATGNVLNLELTDNYFNLNSDVPAIYFDGATGGYNPRRVLVRGNNFSGASGAPCSAPIKLHDIAAGKAETIIIEGNMGKYCTALYFLDNSAAPTVGLNMLAPTTTGEAYSFPPAAVHADTPTDADFLNPQIGMFCLVGSTLWVKTAVSGGWKYVGLT